MSDKLYALDKLKRSHVVASTWPFDKYPEMPVLNAKCGVTLLDVDGAGIVSNIHSSYYLIDNGQGENCYSESEQYMAQIIMRVYYDFHTIADIEMPFFDFLGDVDCKADFFTTKYFSKVPMSHNFRLEMPFAKHIKIEVINPTDKDLMGYTDIQYDELDELKANTGYLYADIKQSEIEIPGAPECLFSSDSAGVIVAHWFKIEGEREEFRNGEGLCEANCEFYIDGADVPDPQYLGIEDLYGFSWGFAGVHSDGYTAITHRENLSSGSRIGMLRCRDVDAISYKKSCRLQIDYSQEYFSADSKNPIHKSNPVFNKRTRYTAKIRYKNCVYYYK